MDTKWLAGSLEMAIRESTVKRTQLSISKKKTGLGSAISMIDVSSLTTCNHCAYSRMDGHCIRSQEEVKKGTSLLAWGREGRSRRPGRIEGGIT